jgi:hypothetical protein
MNNRVYMIILLILYRLVGYLPAGGILTQSAALCQR